ncbi:hypothetical protein E2C01_076843 [Portunus trituberculatus]|uniref:Uncharacterized protein n=1 Tax=Portunus trituberculatus TaxID=210409 RepID=A0A5B7IIT2_PORTR|nr:hypothetical protein [Portunus trituberculatus]
MTTCKVRPVTRCLPFRDMLLFPAEPYSFMPNPLSPCHGPLLPPPAPFVTLPPHLTLTCPRNAHGRHASCPLPPLPRSLAPDRHSLLS